jgi:hypothetical protein
MITHVTGCRSFFPIWGKQNACSSRVRPLLGRRHECSDLSLIDGQCKAKGRVRSISAWFEISLSTATPSLGTSQRVGVGFPTRLVPDMA